MQLPAPPKPNRPRLDALTGVRFFAAMHVLLYHRFKTDIVWGSIDAVNYVQNHHTGGAFGLVAIKFFVAIAWGIVVTGPASVGLFFILSGFILAYSYLDLGGEMIGSRHRFYINRFARVYPTYLLGVILAAPLEFERHLSAFSSIHWGMYVGTGLLNITLMQAWVPLVSTTWNPPGWSLSVEAFFYFTFPIIAVAIMRRASSARALWTGAAGVAVILALGIFHGLLDGHIVPWLHELEIGPYFAFLPVLRLPEFIVGIAIGRWFFLREMGSSRPSGNVWRWVAPLAMIGVLAVFTIGRDRPPTFIFAPAILAVLFAMLICGLAVDDAGTPGRFTRFFGTRPLLLLGEASYAIYIIHVPISKYFDRVPRPVWVNISHTLHLPSIGVANSIFYLLTVIGGAIFIFEVVETPTRLWLRKRLEALFHRPVLHQQRK